MKIGLTKVLALIASIFMILSVSCSGGGGGGGGSTSEKPTVEEISFTGNKTDFVEGDTFELGKDFTVIVKMSDNSTRTVAKEDYTVTLKLGENEYTEPFTTTLTSGDYIVVIELKDGSISGSYGFKVVKDAVVLQSIAITTEPDNSGKYVGDVLNTTGIVITATYSDGSTKNLDATSEGVTISPTTLDNTSNTITVTYTEEGKTETATFTVTAIAVEVESIAITTKPKTSYMGSDKTITLDGMVVTATNNNGTTKILETSEYTTNVEGLSFGDVDEEKDLVVKLASDNTKTASVKLYYSAEVLTLDSIAVKTNPLKTEYFVGDELDISGLVITATYKKSSSDETTTRDITPTLSDVSVDLFTAGTKDATVSYTDGEVTKTATFSVTVNAIALESISIATEPTKKNYIVGDEIVLTGIVVNAVYNDTSKNKEIGKNDLTVTPETVTTSGENVEVTVSYTDGEVTKTATYNVAVADKPTFTVTIVGDKDISITNNEGALTANLNGITGSTITYQWSVDGKDVSTTDTYTPADLASGEVRIVTLIVTVDGTKYSATITLK